MAGVLRAAPGVTDIRIKASTDRQRQVVFPVIEYSFFDERKHHHSTEIALFEVSGIEDEKYAFDASNVENDPVALNLLAEWEIKCQAGVGSFHNELRA